MSEVVELTGKMPFSGKHMVKKWFLDGVRHSRDGDYLGKVANAGVLLGFAALHGLQMKMGINELTSHEGQNPVAVGIDVAYTAANFLATYTQVYLSGAVLMTPQMSDEERMSTPVYQAPAKLEPVTPTEMGVTLGGQMLFLATMQF